MTNSIAPAEQSVLERAERSTTPVVTYKASAEPSTPSQVVGRGTGTFIEYERHHFVVTNTHVLESYAFLKKQGTTAVVQVRGQPQSPGPEEHAGYLLAPNATTSVECGVSSKYDHQDIGLIELTRAGARVVKKFAPFVRIEDFDLSPLKVGDKVAYKGYPSKSAEFHASGRVAFAFWAEFRSVRCVSERIIVTESKPLATVRSDDFSEDGADLVGISGSALWDMQGRVRGVVWGGKDGIHGPIWAVPVPTVIRLLKHYLAEKK